MKEVKKKISHLRITYKNWVKRIVSKNINGNRLEKQQEVGTEKQEVLFVTGF